MRRRARPRRAGPAARRWSAASSTTTASPTSRSTTNGDAVTNGDGAAEPGPWHLDALPLVISATDWDTLESGLVQRSRLLDAVLADLYGPRRVGDRRRAAARSCCSPIPATSGPPAASRCPAGTSCSCTAATSAAPPTARFLVNADWTQAPSGAGYALADRRVVAHAIPDLYERIGPRPASPWAQALRLALIDAAPESAEEPVVVVLSPGIHSETAFDQAYLASVLGFPLVESADLVVRDGKLWMRSLGTLKRVDVVLRRVDADVRRSAGSARRLAAGRGRPGRGAATRRGRPWSTRSAAESWKALGCFAFCPSWPSGCWARRRCWRPRRCTGAASTSSARTC